jgi:hypothetical protein
MTAFMDRGSVTYKNPAYFFFVEKKVLRGRAAGKSVKNASSLWRGIVMTVFAEPFASMVRGEVLKACHDGITAKGHLGRTRGQFRVVDLV